MGWMLTFSDRSLSFNVGYGGVEAQSQTADSSGGSGGYGGPRHGCRCRVCALRVEARGGAASCESRVLV